MGHADYIKANLVGTPGNCFLHGFVEIIPVKHELGLIGRLILSPIDAAQDKVPVARINSALEGYRTADLPTVFLHKLASRDEAFAIA